jgi:hypothetical protein
MYFYTLGIQFLAILAINLVQRQVHPEVLDSNLDTTMQETDLYICFIVSL